MTFDILRFLNDYHIEIGPADRSKRGWVQVTCPFCQGSSRGFDLGINISKNYGNCWLCRGKSLHRIIKALLKCSNEEAKQIILDYKEHPSLIPEEETRTNTRAECKLPPDCGPMQQQHDNYLISRNFDPELLEKTYGLLGTGRIGEYKNRIIVPLHYNQKIVSYQGRIIFERPKVKGFDDRWKACPLDDEVIHHQHLLYGIDLCKRDCCAVVEGASDAWRMGPECVGLFGLGYTAQQIILLTQRFKRIFLMLDPETQAQQIAKEIGWHAAYSGVETIIVDLETDCDPGDLPQDEANAIMRQLNLKGWN